MGITCEGGQRERETKVRVVDWPSRNAVWRVHTADQRGRRLVVCTRRLGNASKVVGSLGLHVEPKASLMVVSYERDDSLLDHERVEALAEMLACAEAIAAELETLGIGDGCHEGRGDVRAVSRLQDDQQAHLGTRDGGSALMCLDAARALRTRRETCFARRRPIHWPSSGSSRPCTECSWRSLPRAPARCRQWGVASLRFRAQSYALHSGLQITSAKRICRHVIRTP